MLKIQKHASSSYPSFGRGRALRLAGLAYGILIHMLPLDHACHKPNSMLDGLHLPQLAGFNRHEPQ